MIVELELDDDLVTSLTEYQASLFVDKNYNATTEELITKIVENFVDEKLETRDEENFPLFEKRIDKPQEIKEDYAI